jgi:hypothetical protein
VAHSTRPRAVGSPVWRSQTEPSPHFPDAPRSRHRPATAARVPSSAFKGKRRCPPGRDGNGRWPSPEPAKTGRRIPPVFSIAACWFASTALTGHASRGSTAGLPQVTPGSDARRSGPGARVCPPLIRLPYAPRMHAIDDAPPMLRRSTGARSRVLRGVAGRRVRDPARSTHRAGGALGIRRRSRVLPPRLRPPLPPPSSHRRCA